MLYVWGVCKPFKQLEQECLTLSAGVCLKCKFEQQTFSTAFFCELETSDVHYKNMIKHSVFVGFDVREPVQKFFQLHPLWFNILSITN